MKKKDKRPSSSEFQANDPDKEFQKLMKQVSPPKLKKSKPGVKPKKIKLSVADSIKFERDITDDLDFAQANPEKKFSNLAAPPIKKQIPKKRKKISPGFLAEAEIDLHGYTRSEALQRIELFVEGCRKSKNKSALIITGKGQNSLQEGGILRNAAWHWLEGNQRRFNIRFRWAPKFLGGKGAILVFFN